MNSSVELHCGDCLDILRTMKDRSVDAVITDPPYGISYVTNRRTWRVEIAKPIENDDSVPTEIIPSLARIIKGGGALYWFCSEMGIYQFNTEARKSGLVVKRSLVWDKGSWAAGDLFGDWAVQTEYVAWASKGRHLLREGRPSNLIRVARQVAATREVSHPSEKPILLMEKLILASTDIGATILDPFMGSGTTGVACVQTGRNFIGIEISPEYYAIAQKRIAQAQAQPALFQPDSPRYVQPRFDLNGKAGGSDG